MPSVEEILADLEASEEKEAEGEEKEEAPGSENATIKQIRDAQKTWEKKARDLGKALKASEARVAEFEDTQRRTTAEGVFKEIGLSEKQAALYLKNHEGDVTSESIRQFVTDYDLADLSKETGGTTEEKSGGFQPGGTGNTESSTAALMPRKEWLQLVGTDPARAEKLLRDGRVDNTDVGFGP